VKNAHINVLPSFQSTGIKLKLLFALFQGRHCLISPELIVSDDISKTVVVCKSTQEWREKIVSIAKISFDDTHLSNRKEAAKSFDNSSWANKLIEILSA
jgi:ribosomal protein L17